MPNFTAAFALLKKPIDDIYEVAKGAVKDKVAQMRAASKVQGLHKRLWETQKVKTIWHTDRPLSLSSFFYPVSVMRQDHDEKIIVQLTSLDALPNNHNLIFGTVGQGKSILLRFLLGKEIKTGKRVPIFCELRNIGNSSLEEFLEQKFKLLLKLDDAEGVFETFAENGKLSFLLDGFDEVESTQVQRVMSEIDDLSFKYADCRIVLTSRPDSDCKHLTTFHVNKICPLKPEVLENFYNKITRDKDLTSRLVSAIKNSPLQIRELVNTPLLATLLAISYRAAQKIPLDFAEFYDELFQILLVRHDGAKLGWRRTRKTKLNDREIQKVFEAFCFATRRNKLLSLDRDVAARIAEESIKKSQLSADSQSFLDDIRKITCLLVEEGKKYNFVHSSVPEFFAASFLKNRSESVAENFYSQLLVNGKWQEWRQEILFLLQIDNHRAEKYFKLPDLEKTLNYIFNGEERISVDNDVVERYLESKSVIKENVIRQSVSQPRYYVSDKGNIPTNHYENLDSRAFSILFNYNDGALSWREGFDSDPKSKERTYLQIAKDKGNKSFSSTLSLLRGYIEDLVAQRNLLRAKIKKEDTPDSFIQLQDDDFL